MTTDEKRILRTLADGVLFAAQIAPAVGIAVMECQDLLGGLRRRKLVKFHSHLAVKFYGWELTDAGREAIG